MYPKNLKNVDFFCYCEIKFSFIKHRSCQLYTYKFLFYFKSLCLKLSSASMCTVQQVFNFRIKWRSASVLQYFMLHWHIIVEKRVYIDFYKSRLTTLDFTLQISLHSIAARATQIILDSMLLKLRYEKEICRCFSWSAIHIIHGKSRSS